MPITKDTLEVEQVDNFHSMEIENENIKHFTVQKLENVLDEIFKQTNSIKFKEKLEVF